MAVYEADGASVAMSSAAQGGLVIDVFGLARKAAEISGALSPAALPRLAPSLTAGSGPLAYVARGATDDSGRPILDLRWSMTAALTCDLCSKPLELPLAHEQQFLLLGSESEVNALPVDPEERFEPIAGSAQFDLADLLQDEVLLALPMSPRHGACAQEAAGPTLGGAAEGPHPFAALAQLKPRGH